MSTATPVAPSPARATRPTATAAARLVGMRILPAAVVVVAVTFLVFLFIHAAPGGPEQSLAGPYASADQLDRIRATYHLDDPLLEQYGRFLWSALQLDLGTSISTREPVVVALGRAAGVSLPLLLAAWVTASLLGCLLGVVSARRPGTTLDRGVLAATVVGASSPVFAVGVALAYVFGVVLGWLPTVGSGAGGADTLRHLALPTVTLAIVALAAVTKVVRVRVGQVLEDDQVTFAVGRGLSRRQVMVGTVLRGAGVQIVTQSGAVLVSMIGGLIVIEEVFALDGIGSLLVGAITSRDIPLIQGITLCMAVFIIAVNLAVDVFCLVIDPRLARGVGSDG